MLFIFYITWLYCFCSGVETSTAQATMNPTTFQSLLQHTQVFYDQHPLPKQLHTPARQPEPSYHLLSHQYTQQPSSYRHESDIPPVGPRQEEVTSQSNLWGSWQSFAFLSACFSAVLACLRHSHCVSTYLLSHWQLLSPLNMLYNHTCPQVLALGLDNKIKFCTLHIKVK